jgi:GcvH upstream region-like protein
MLAYLRKYQKVIFGVVAFMVIASFSFFGTYGAIQTEKSVEEDVALGKTIDSKDLSSKELAQMARFLQTDFYDMMTSPGRGDVNLLNDGFVRNDLLKTGLGHFIFQSYKSEIWEELSKKVAKFKQFKTYIHPRKFVTFEGLLTQFAPHYAQDLESFRIAQNEEEIFDNLAKLYVDQTIFPPEMVRRMMLYMEYQYAHAANPDPNLKNIDLSLFYAKNLTDWFGSKFLEKSSLFVINGAAFARKQGYKVSLEEAKSLLLQNAIKRLKEFDSSKTITNEELNKFYKQQLALLQMDENDALKTAQKILVFKKLLDEVGKSVFLDSTLYTQFNELASAGAVLEVYKLPSYLRCKSEQDFFKLEAYLQGVTKNSSPLLLNTEFASVEEVKKKAPELLEKRFLVNVASLKKGNLVTDIGVRKTWDWEIKEENWALLKQEFKELDACIESDYEARFSYLQGLDQRVQEKIDQFARRKILDSDPNFIKEKLSLISPQKQVISLAYAGEEEILPGIKDQKKLLDLLENSSERLSCYSENGEDFHHIEVIDKNGAWEVVTFQEASQRGMLDKIVLKRGIKEGNKLSSADYDLKLVAYMKKMLELVVSGDETSVFEEERRVARDSLESGAFLERQWDLKREKIRVMKKSIPSFLDEKLFSREEKEWSEVISSSEGPIFYRVIEKFVDTSDVGKKIQEARALLGSEAKLALSKEILEKMQALNQDNGS